MRSPSDLQWLAAVQGLAVVALFVLLTMYLRESQTASYQQALAANHQRNAIAYGELINDSVLYAERNPSIEPVLNSIGVQINRGPAAPVAPPASPAPRH